MKRRLFVAILFFFAFYSCSDVSVTDRCQAKEQTQGTSATPNPPRVYSDGRPSPAYRLEAKDSGPLLKHGDGPANCDINGMREASAFEHEERYYLYYDGCGANGWAACLAT
ncbi:MAG: hypothetical protein FWD31_01965, partial [Planctomycetaceae bacterium]|nr:hypothetical protein [Planctomycetaceae bacterium]